MEEDLSERLLSTEKYFSMDRSKSEEFYNETELPLKSEDLMPCILQQNKRQGLNRIQLIGNVKYKPNKRYLKVELNLTLILIREMLEYPQLQLGMMVSSLFDVIVRINSLVFLSLILHDSHKYDYISIIILIVPRLFHILAQVKLLFIKLHKPKFRSISQIAILYQQNFTKIDLELEQKKEWYEWRRQLNMDTFRKLLFIALPTELNILALPLLSRKARITYIVSSIILTTIEMICFYPFFLTIIYINRFAEDNPATTNHQVYSTFTLVMVYVSLAKYTIICSVFLTKRNIQINK